MRKGFCSWWPKHCNFLCLIFQLSPFPINSVHWLLYLLSEGSCRFKLQELWKLAYVKEGIYRIVQVTKEPNQISLTLSSFLLQEGRNMKWSLTKAKTRWFVGTFCSKDPGWSLTNFVVQDVFNRLERSYWIICQLYFSKFTISCILVCRVCKNFNWGMKKMHLAALSSRSKPQHLSSGTKRGKTSAETEIQILLV